MKTLKSVTASFKALGKIDLNKALSPIDQELANFASKQFQTQGAYGGKPWAGFSGEPKYLKLKRAIGASDLPLRWKPGIQERLYPALVSTTNNYRNFIQGNKFVRLDIDLPYMASLERGGTNPITNERYPGREIFPPRSKRLNDDIKRAVSQVFYNEVAQLTGIVPVKQGR